MRDPRKLLEAGLIAASRWIGREVARMVVARVLRRLAAYETTQRYSQVESPRYVFS